MRDAAGRSKDGSERRGRLARGPAPADGGPAGAAQEEAGGDDADVEPERPVGAVGSDDGDPDRDQGDGDGQRDREAGPPGEGPAAAAGPIISVNISSAPTTGMVMLAARAITSRKHSSIRRVLTPRASAISGSADHRCSVETLSVTALFRALTSASIQVW